MGNTTSTTEVAAEQVDVQDATAAQALADARAMRDARGDRSRPPSLNVTPNVSSHGSDNFAKQIAAADAQATKEAPPPALGNSTHGGLSVWNWSYNRTPDAPVTPTAVTPGNSQHNGVSFWNWGAGRATPPASASASRNASQHNGSKFSEALASANAKDAASKPGDGASRSSSVHGGGILRNVNWPGNSPTEGTSRSASMHGGNNFGGSSSRSASTHGGVHFAKNTVELSKSRERTGSISGDLWNWGKGREPAPGEPPLAEPEPSPPTMKRKNSLSAIWDWSIGRGSPPATPGASREGSMHGVSNGAPAMMQRSDSMSGMWNWSLGRESSSHLNTPGGSREASVHNGAAEKQEGNLLPWGIKLKYGADSERPV